MHRARGRAAGADFPFQIEADRNALTHLVGEVVDADPERLEPNVQCSPGVSHISSAQMPSPRSSRP